MTNQPLGYETWHRTAKRAEHLAQSGAPYFVAMCLNRISIAPINAATILEIGRDWQKMVTSWIPQPSEISFLDDAGNEHKITFEPGDETEGGWLLENYVVVPVTPQSPSTVDERVKNALEPFIAAARVCDFFVEDAIPEMTFPIAGTKTIAPSDAPPSITLTAGDFLELRAALDASREK